VVLGGYLPGYFAQVLQMLLGRPEHHVNHLPVRRCLSRIKAVFSPGLSHALQPPRGPGSG
jgi:hypothetical protein